MIVAIDPGVTTGVAVYDTEWSKPFLGFELDEHGFYQWIEENADEFDHCQIEQFVINAATVRKTIVYDSLYLIGFLRYMSHRHDFPIGFTKPADVMQSFPDTSLRRAGWFKPGLGHSNDAARHLAHYMVRTRKLSGGLFLP